MHDLPLITTLAAIFTVAWVLGIITQSFKLSPIVGYLLAGVVISPYTPGFVGDITLASQLAEVGVILLMFGVGLHFHLHDLLRVRHLAIPGAIGQCLVATLLGIAVALAFGWSFNSGLVLGMALSVASTVVLVRVLEDNKVLDTTQGHVAVGWLIMEDIFTVIVLVLIPALAINGDSDSPSAANLGLNLLWALAKLAALVAILLFAGAKIIPWIMVQIARLRSRELFTLTVLVMAITIAAGSSYLFGSSMALGAFLAGMVVGQSKVSHQAAADALPLRDAFAVIFFASVGMLFDPAFIFRQPALTLACLAIVMIGKPLAAILIVAVIGYPARTALTVAVGLAQIGEFSFILANLSHHHGLLSDDANNVLVACAIISITLNPVLFRFIPQFESSLQRWPTLWKFLNRNSGLNLGIPNQLAIHASQPSRHPVAVIVGYGPVGRSVDSLLRNSSLQTIVVDLNMDTIESLTREGRPAIYGDAYNIEVLAQALTNATHLIITLPHSANRNPMIIAAKLINPTIKIFVRARYIAERTELIQVGADAVCYEETEAAVALARLVLIDQNADDQTVHNETTRIRDNLTSPI